MLIPLLVIIVVDIYVFQAVKTSFSDSKPSTQRIINIIYWALSSITYFTLLFIFSKGYPNWHGWSKNIFVGIAQAMFLGKVLFLPFLIIDDFIRIARWAAGLFTSADNVLLPEQNGISRIQFLSKLGLGLGSLTFGALIYGISRGAFNYKKTKIKIPIKDLPDEWAGLKIVQISDFHIGSFANANPVEKIVDLVNAENADMIFFTGDLVNYSVKEATPYLEILKRLKAKTKIYSILGNHDYGLYLKWDKEQDRIDNFQQLLDMQKNDLGWDLLMDENRIWEKNGKKLAIIGVQYIGHNLRFGKFGDLHKAYQGAEDANVQLLLSHDPSHWDHEVSQNEKFNAIDATFSGHTHGFQFGIEIPSIGLKWSPSQYVYPHWAGLYKNKKQHLYVNRGIGFLGYPGRLGISPEISIFQLVKT